MPAPGRTLLNTRLRRSVRLGGHSREGAVLIEGLVPADADRSRLYVDLIHLSISEAARRALCAVDMSKYEYQSDFAKQYIAMGKTEGIEIGRMEGRADLITQLLTMRFGALSEVVRARIATSSLSQLDDIGERLLTARTLEEALG